MSFRPATPADLERLLPLVAAFYAEDGYAFDEAASRAALARLLFDGSLGRVWLAEADGRAVAYVVVAFGYSLEFRGRDAFLDEVYVRPAYRGRGLGTRAIALAEDACRRKGVRALHLEVELENPGAHALYGRSGFVEHSRRLMTKKLRTSAGEGGPGAPPETIATPRLRLRPPGTSDAPQVTGWAADPEATRFMIWPTHRDPAEAVAFLAACAPRWESGEEHVWAIVEPPGDEAVGTIGVRLRGHAAELGWILARSRWGRGYATEAASALVAALEAMPAVRRLWAITNVANAASARVMEKIGMRREGLLRAHAVYPNLSPEPCDSFVYARARP